MNKRLFLISFILLILLISSTITAQQLSPQEEKWISKSYRIEKNGWIFLHIEGEPFERGFQRGYLTHIEIKEFLNTLTYIIEFKSAKKLEYFIERSVEFFKDKGSKEYNDEMKGIVSGMEKAGTKISFKEILFMNGFIDIWWYWWDQEKKNEGPGCSAFIATGDATTDGKVIMAHNTWFCYYFAQYCNFIIDIVPIKGHRILMQSWAPFLYSGTDFFITGAGLIGCETTIGGFSGFDKNCTPVFERARKAMQYANNIDEWSEIMIKDNNGAYANSWLLGDINTNEIARFEIGLKHHSLEKKKSGYFTGSNLTQNIKILRDETDASYDDIRQCCVARSVRWKQLMKNNFGKIDIDIAKVLLGDHYDVYLEKEKPGNRTICGHGELDDGSVPGNPWGAYDPCGAFDGKVVNSDLAKNFKFYAKWGSPCGLGFDADKYLKRHLQYDWLKGYITNLPSKPWTIFPVNKD